MKPTLIPLQGEQAEVSPFPLHCPVYITNTSTDTNSSGDHTNTSAGHGHGRSILAPGRSQIIAQGSVTEVLLQMGLPKKRKHGREREHGDLELLYRVSVSLPLHLQNSNRDTNANTDANADKDAKSNMSCLCYKSDLRYSHGCPVSVSIHGSESDSDSDSNSNAWMDGIILGITEMPTYDIRRESGDYSSDTFFYVVELLDSNGDGNGHSSTDSEKASTGKPRNVTVLHDVSPSEVRFRLPKNENTRTCEIKPNREEEEEAMVPKRNINRREKKLLDSTDSENTSTGKPRNVTVLHDISPSEVRRGLATNDNIKIKSNRREKEDIVPKRNINRQEKEEVIVIKCESETEHQIEAEKEMEKEYETDDNKTDADADADPTSVCSNSINVNSNRNANLRIKIDAGAKAEAAFVQDINLQIRQDGALTRKNMKHGTGTCNEHDNYNGKGHHDDGYAADSIATAQSYSHDPNSHKVKVEFDLKDDRDCDDNYRGVPDPVITSSISAPVRRQRQQIPTLRPLASLCTGVSKSGPVVVAAAVSVLPESKLYTKPEPRPDTSTTALPAAMQTCSLNKRKSHKLEANRGDDASETSNMDKDSDVDADADADDTSPSKRICVERNSSVNMDLKNHLGFEGADVDATDACTGTNSGEEIICLSSDDEAVLDPASMKIPKRRRRSIKVDSHHSVVDDNRNQGQIGLDTGIETARFCDDVPPTTCPRPPPLHESHQSSQFRPGIRGYAIMDKPARMNQAQSTYYSPRKCQGKNRRKPKPPSPPKVFPFFSIVQFSISSSSIFGAVIGKGGYIHKQLQRELSCWYSCSDTNGFTQLHICADSAACVENATNVLRDIAYNSLSRTMSDDEVGRIVDDTCVDFYPEESKRDVGCSGFGRMHSTKVTRNPGQHHSEQDCGRPHSLQDKCAMRLILPHMQYGKLHDLIVGKQGCNHKRLKEEIKNCSKISLVEDYTRVRDHYVEVCGQTHSYAERGCVHILRYLEHHLNKALPQARIAMHQSNPN